jgi:hypothetical protein
MWILKNSNERFKKNVSKRNSIKTHDFSTLYTTIPHEKLKSRLFDIIDNCSFNENGKREYSYLVISHQKHYFVKYLSNFTQKYFEIKIKKMIEFLIDNIFVAVGGLVFQQSVKIPMDTNCDPLLADLILYSYEVEFIQKLLYEKKKYLAVVFNFSFRYTDDVLSISNNQFHTCVHFFFFFFFFFFLFILF